MKAAFLTEKEKMKVLQETKVKKRTLDKDDVRISTKAVTVCASDLRYFCADLLPHNLSYPLILGHEMAGIVTETGKDVKRVKVGDHVCIEPGIWCGTCDACNRNEYQFCGNMKFMASKGFQGALKEEVIWPQKNVFVLPDGMNYEMGALMEPLAVAYSAVRKIDMARVECVAVLGAGSIGMLCGKLLRILKPETKINFIDILSEKTTIGEKLGFQRENFRINEGIPDIKWDAVIDTTGNGALVRDYALKLRKGGHLVLVGISSQKLSFTFDEFINGGIKISSSYRYHDVYEELLAMLKENHHGIEHMITHKFSFEESQKAFQTAKNDASAQKVCIEFE